MKKSRKDYKAALKIIRPFVRFNYDLRKPLSRGQKSAITKALSEVVSHRSKTFVPFRKNQKLSRKDQREIKKTAGQTGHRINMIKGVFVDVKITDPKKIKIQLKKKRIVIKTPGFTEFIIPADHRLLALDEKAYAETIFNKLNFNEIFVDYSGYGRSIGFQKTGTKSDDRILDRFIAEISSMANRYHKVLEHAISGFILRVNN